MSSDIRALQYTWDEANRCLRPLGVHAMAAALKQFKDAARYVMQQHRERSGKSHRHFFAAVEEAHDNLPDKWAKEFPTVEKLRKYVLIRVGWSTHTAYACDTERDAITLMRALKSIDDYAVVKREGSVVNYFVAKSQSESNMDKEEFETVKDRSLDLLAQMLGVTKSELTKSAGQSA